MRMIDLVDLRPVILAARQYSYPRNILTRFLPNVEVMSVSYNLGRRTTFDQTVAVRAFGAPAIPIKRGGAVAIKGDLPAITPRVDFSESDLNTEFLLAQQLAGQPVDWTNWVSQAAGEAALTVDNTLEAMRAQVLSTGKVQLTTEDGEVYEVDFEVDNDNIIPADDPDEILENLEIGHERYIDSSGGEAGAILTSSKVYRKLAAQVQDKTGGNGATAVGAYLADRGLPEIVTYDRAIRAEDGTRNRLFPVGTATFLPEGNTVGRTELGVTQEALQLRDKQILSPLEVAGLTIVTLGQDDPVERSVKAAALGMPVLRDVDDIVIVTNLLGPDEEDEYGSGG